MCAVKNSEICIMAWKLDEIGGVVMCTHLPSLITEIPIGGILALNLKGTSQPPCGVEKRPGQLQAKRHFFVSFLFLMKISTYI